MNWVNVTAAGRRDELENLESWFWDNGAVSVTVEDGKDNPIFEPPPGEHPLWEEVLVTGLFEDSLDSNGIEQALESAGFHFRGAVELEDRPWEREWLTRFQPMQFGQRLWVCPTGYELEPENKTIIHLDPGLAFGTGTHETTRLCLEYLDGLPLAGRTVLDYGCGSGILAIAAGLLGARSLVGVDNDRQALIATQENAQRNGVHIQTLLPPEDDQALETADVVLANILAQPLVDLSARLAGYCNPGGVLILSGIMSSQADWVKSAYQAHLSLVDENELDGWVRLVYARAA